MVLLIPLAFLLCVWSLRKRGEDWANAILRGALVFGVVVAALTELLSLLRWIAPLPLEIAWGITDAALATFAWRAVRGRPPGNKRRNWGRPVLLGASVGALLAWGCFQVAPLPIAWTLPTSLTGLLIGLAVVVFALRFAPERFRGISPSSITAGLAAMTAVPVVLVGTTAYYGAPNTWDALTYHLTRVVFWAEHHSVALFPASYSTLLVQPPWTEFVFLHLSLLSGTDRYVNLVQSFAWLGCAFGVSCIARRLGASWLTSALVALVAATIPQGVLEASGPKNDCVVAFWLVCLVYFLLSFGHKPGGIELLSIGAALGLAVFTKGTAYAFAPPLIATSFLSWRREAQAAFLRRSYLVILVVLAINIGQYARNWQFSGNLSGLPPSATGQRDPLINARLGIAPTYSNLVRNLSLHISSEDLEWNRKVFSWVKRAHAALHLDLNDPSTTYPGTEFGVVPPGKHEITVGNPVHLLLFLLAGSASLMVAVHARNWTACGQLAGLLIAFLSFCAIFRWQPWHTRLHLPLFVLASVVTLAPIDRWLMGIPALALASLLLTFAAPFVTGNFLRPLAGLRNVFEQNRESAYLNDNPSIFPEFINSAKLATQAGCTQIGLDVDRLPLPYALMVYIRQIAPDAYFVNQSPLPAAKRFATPEDQRKPCALICAGCAADLPVASPYYEEFGPVTAFGRTLVFVSRPPRTATGNDACQYRFTTGWYPPEAAGTGTLRWASQEATVELRSAQPGELSLSGQIGLAMPQNQVEVSWPGRVMSLPQNVNYLNVRVPVPPDGTTVRFKGKLPGLATSLDLRALGFSLAHLLVTTRNETLACTPL